ncbi:MAG: transcription-repair coupling factor [candidate division Zixibacteria bacterium]|nr:transcription-repair coupling factor [candidate division Zixibacteria bacterium]
MLDQIISGISKTDKFSTFVNSLKQPDVEPLNISGISGSFLAALTGAVYSELKKTILIVVPEEEPAAILYNDIKNFVPSDDIFHLCRRGIYPFQIKTTYFENSGTKLEAMYALLNKTSVVIASAASLTERTVPPEQFSETTLEIVVNEEYEMEDVVSYLSRSGYKRVGMVEEVGDYAVRGGLIDLFPASSEYPLRVEFFGDEIESIRNFSVSSQRSLDNLDKILLLPRREFQMDDSKLKTLLNNFTQEEADALYNALLIDDPTPGLEWLVPLSGKPNSSVIDYIPDDAIVFLSEPDLIKEKFVEFESITEGYKDKATQSGIPTCDLDKLIDSYDKISGNIEKNPLVNIFPFKISGRVFTDFESYTPTISGLKPNLMKNQIDNLLNEGFSVFVACDNSGQRDRVEELLGDTRPDLSFGVARIQHGFVFPEAEFTILTDHELFGHRTRRRPRRFKEGVSLPNYRSLNPGDYVVHIDFGVGQYNGLQTITVEGRRRDCLYINYRDGDRIYVPIEQFNRVQKYSGSESNPRLSKLGTAAWAKILKRAKKAVMEMAQELIQIYARRKVSPGFAFPPDSEWIKQLEASFPYEETADQITSLAEIKSDMENPLPMDRLVCGDVGYGKTELAIRAAFKAVEGGKQVALIAPTTILTQQHYDTFRSRMADFPVQVSMLSRFVERSQQKKTINEIAEGNVDIVVGTHRLLSKDIIFKDIGLLIVDEEQRFGVTHKEKLKRWRTVVDVLTLTATPIPRTMQLSLFGARDMSSINTPPKDRRPIITEITPFSEKAIIEAVLREVDRGGQVFFVHNRVQSIDAMYRYLKKILPQVSFGVAHGQMQERQLEKIMMSFSLGEFQVMVATTIIESGLDIPSVNTIIINRTDKLGLAQLYQLRGRVGRSDRQAYAYFMIPPYRLLSEIAKRRLKAMEEFTALGSGFHLALRDLEIRGAGNLLGRQQHGFIEEVGFDLYCRLLDETVAELKGEEPSERVDTKLSLDCDLYIPDDYIPDKDLRVDLYRRLADAKDYSDVQSILEESTDRFGRPPDTVDNLFEMAGIRISAQKLGASRMMLKGEKIILEFSNGKSITKEMVTGFIRATDRRIEFFTSDVFQMDIYFDGSRAKEGLSSVTKTMKDLAGSIKQIAAQIAK